MSSDIISSLHLDKDTENSRVILVKELGGCDSTFITSCVLGHALKQNIPTLLVLIHNPLSHYQNIGLRMFYNLQKSIESGKVDVYNLSEKCMDSIFGSQNLLLNDLFCEIKYKVEQLQIKYGSASIIVDGVTHLFDLLYSIREVNNFCKQLLKLTTMYNNTFTLFHCNVARNEDTSCLFANNLSHMSHTVVEVSNLASGWSADVSGHIKITQTINKFDKQFMHHMDLKPTPYLFKLFDKGVKLFAPGTV